MSKTPNSLDENRRKSLSPWAWAFAVLAFGAFLAAFFNLYVFREFDPVNTDLLSIEKNPALAQDPALLEKESFMAQGRQTGVLWLADGALAVPFTLKRPSAGRLRLQAYFPETSYGKPALSFYVNGSIVASVRPRWKGGYEEFNVNVPKVPFVKGANTLLIRPEAPGAFKVGYESINVRDFVGYSKNFPRAFVFFDENLEEKGRRVLDKPFSFALFPSLVFLLWVFAGNAMRASKGIPLRNALKRLLYWYLPITVLFAGAFVYTALTPFTVVLHPDTFYALVLAPAVVSMLLGLPRLVASGMTWLKDNTKTRNPGPGPVAEALGRIRSKDLARAKNAFTAIAAYTATAAITGFILFLVTAGVMLILKRQATAETMADIAYFLLLFGVLLRLFDLTRNEEG